MTDRTESPLRLNRATSEDYRAGDARESLKIAKEALMKRLDELSKEVGDEAVKTLEKRYETSLETFPEPAERPTDDSTSQYLIVKFGKINNLKYHFSMESARPIDEATGFLAMTVRSRNLKKKDSKRWEDLLKTTTKETPLNSMVDSSIIVSACGDLEIRGTLMGSLYSVASTVPFGSFKILFPSSTDMSDEMKKCLSEGEHVQFCIQLNMTRIKGQNDNNETVSPSRTRIQLVRAMSAEELEECNKSKDHVFLLVTFHMFDPENYVHTLTFFHAHEIERLEKGKHTLEQMTRRHMEAARDEAEIREARLRDEENCIKSMEVLSVESEIQLEKERRERCRQESSSDGLSHLAKLRVLEDSFERRLREKELQENIGTGLVLRQNMQLQLKEQREHLNLQFRNRWREIVESHVTDIEDSELGIDKDYLCLLRDRDDIDDSDLSLMTNVHVKKKDSSRSLDDSSGEYHSMPFGLWRSTTIKDSKQSNAMKRWLNTSFLGECL